MGCLKSIVSLVVIVIVAGLLWLNRDKLTSKWHAMRGGNEVMLAVPSEEWADSAEAKLLALKSGKSERVVLRTVELQSLLQFKYRELLPAFVDSPRVELKGSKIQVLGRVPLDRIPDFGSLGEAAAILPDTTELSVTGELLPLTKGRVALAVDQVSASRIPLPRRLVPGALRRLGRKDEPGLPREAMAVPLPPGVDAAYVRGDSLVFLSNTRH